MNRRDIIKGLASLPFLGLIGFKATKAESKKTIEEYKGFKISWSGYRSYPDMDKISGYWLAVKSDDIGFYSSSGGYSGEYKLGYVMNTALNTLVLKDHIFLVNNSPQIDRDIEMNRAFKKLIEEIDNYYVPKPKLAHNFNDNYVMRISDNGEYGFGFRGFEGGEDTVFRGGEFHRSTFYYKK